MHFFEKIEPNLQQGTDNFLWLKRSQQTFHACKTDVFALGHQNMSQNTRIQTNGERFHDLQHKGLMNQQMQQEDY